jgi:5-enolpyruvylshikimate-3-phosphate synthase
LASNFLIVLSYEDWLHRRPVEKAAPWLMRIKTVTKHKRGEEIDGADVEGGGGGFDKFQMKCNRSSQL